MDSETTYAVALSHLTQAGPIRLRRVLAVAGSFEGVFALTEAELLAAKLPREAARAVLERSTVAEAERAVAQAHEEGVAIAHCLSATYPRRLAELPDAPIVLYRRGHALADVPRVVAVVGTRKPTAHGRAWCTGFVEALAEFDVALVSGLAYGVDAAAHEAAVRYGVPTVGVLAHGLQEVYPAAHRKLAHEMLAAGALVTEYPYGVRSRREYFPQRNRIVAGLADAVVVVESGARGGSMITADLACGYHRAVFAVPGRVGDGASEGCNLLIKSQRAHLITGVDDLAYVLGWRARPVAAGRATAPELPLDLDPVQHKVLELLRAAESVHVDTLLSRSSIPSGKLAVALLDLEVRGAVLSLPGKRYALT